MERLYFIRIGGTAMGSVAGALASAGWEVCGSEESLYEPMKSYLARTGVHVFPSFDPNQLLEAAPDRVVVGNAVSRGNPELEAALDARIRLVSLPELINQSLIGRKESIVISGTHGKTTTTSMTAWMLECGGLQPGFLIGGVPGNFDVGCRPGAGKVFVTEGDEYDSAYWDKRSKFMHYRPDVAVINNIDFDHGDIFKDLEDVLKSFRLFSRLPPKRGLLLANGDDENVRSLLESPVCPVETFGLGKDCDWRIADSDADGFTLAKHGEEIGRVSSSAVGEMNHRNMAVACILGLRQGMDWQTIQAATSTYKAPKRRMEELCEWNGALVIDDFGHHPAAVSETLKALQTRYPGRRLVAVFEPRTNTTTRNVMQAEITNSFELASAVAFGPLDRPERYQAHERLDLDQVVADLQAQGKQATHLSPEQSKDPRWGVFVAQWLSEIAKPNDVIALFSNGDLGGLRAELLGSTAGGS